MNALDIIIEDTKSRMLEWGGTEPDFMLCSSKLCFQLTMTQERTEYYTQVCRACTRCVLLLGPCGCARVAGAHAVCCAGPGRQEPAQARPRHAELPRAQDNQEQEL